MRAAAAFVIVSLAAADPLLIVPHETVCGPVTVTRNDRGAGVETYTLTVKPIDADNPCGACQCRINGHVALLALDDAFAAERRRRRDWATFEAVRVTVTFELE